MFFVLVFSSILIFDVLFLMILLILLTLASLVLMSMFLIHLNQNVLTMDMNLICEDLILEVMEWLFHQRVLSDEMPMPTCRKLTLMIQERLAREV